MVIDRKKNLSFLSLSIALMFLTVSFSSIAHSWYDEIPELSEEYREKSTSQFPNINELSTHQAHSCAILDDGSVRCWGLNDFGQIGDRTTTDRLIPTMVVEGIFASSIATGYRHTCAIIDTGSVSCWGKNNNGELGDGTNINRVIPTATASLGLNRTAIDIGAGDEFTCALLDNNSITCWGGNSNTPTLSNIKSESYPNKNIVDFDVGSRICVILDDGSVSCWENNDLQHQRITNFGSGRDAVSVSSGGGGHTCAILEDGSLSCWDPDDTSPTEMTWQIGDDRTVISVNVGGSHVCAVLDDGTVSCWGSNNNGQLGDGTIGVTYNGSAVSVKSGYGHTCVILDSGSITCWGDNYYGQLGDGTTIGGNTPVQINLSERILTFPKDAVEISSGAEHTCIITNDSLVSCWGRNTDGQLGDGTVLHYSKGLNTPSNVTSSLGPGRTAVSISTSLYQTCAILDDGSVSCWGLNREGQLGDGTNINRLIPTQTASLGVNRTAISISTYYDHTCVILDNGNVSCWGDNRNWQLGDGTNINRLVPTNTAGLGDNRTAIAISSGQGFTCAILDDGSVSCWGQNIFGKLGDGTNETIRSTPTQTLGFGGNRTAIAISSGTHHTCVLLNDGNVSCWGANWNGQLGVGTNVGWRNTPAQTLGFGDNRVAVMISAHNAHTCALLDDGTVSCWGWNGQGQLGDGTTTSSNIPVQTSIGDNSSVVSISSGSYHTCAVIDDGSVSCWGGNAGGQLGDGSYNDRLIPTQTTKIVIYIPWSNMDSDGDGVLDWFDDLPNNHTETIDTDSDGIGNNADGDDDDDGWTDNLESICYTDSLDNTSLPNDYDLDWICDLIDDDDDGDGVDDNWDVFPLDHLEWYDTDSDGIGNNADDDDDGDGTRDTIDSFPLDSFESSDTDNDGIGNNADSDDDNDGWTDNLESICYTDSLDNTSLPNDYDLDWICDLIDDDDDGDGILDSNDSFPLDPSESSDTDNDGIGNNADDDDDGDGVDDNLDLFPLNHLEWYDTDSDGIGNNADGDDDGDLVLDVNDFCPQGEINWTSGAALGTDHDGDGCRDEGEDKDDDGDGVLDIEDGCSNGHIGWTSNPINDIDGDGCHEIEDYDNDGDGFNNIDDIFPNDPLEWNDADGDGVGDNSDVFPDDASETVDTDGDGVGDNKDAFPSDFSRWEAVDDSFRINLSIFTVIALLGVILILLIGLVVFIKKNVGKS